MRKRLRLLGVLAAAALSMMWTLPVHAQATRTWVSGVGDDANPCSRTAPCKTWAGAISKTASGGEIDALDPGGFGAVTITKSITLDGGGGQVASVLVVGTNGVVIAGSGVNVTIRNIYFDGLLTGGGTAGLNAIRFIQGNVLHVEHCTIFGFTNAGIDFEPSTAGTASLLFVRDTQVQEANGGGILVKPNSGATARASLENVRLDNNSVGLRAEDGSRVVVGDSAMTGNTGDGVFAFSGAGGVAEISLDKSRIAVNGNNGLETSGANADIRITNSSIINNFNNGVVGGPNIVSWVNNTINGNGFNGLGQDGTPGTNVAPK